MSEYLAVFQNVFFLLLAIAFESFAIYFIGKEILRSVKNDILCILLLSGAVGGWIVIFLFFVSALVSRL